MCQRARTNWPYFCSLILWMSFYSWLSACLMNPNKNMSESRRISYDLCCWCSCLSLLINSNKITRVHLTEISNKNCFFNLNVYHFVTLRCQRYHLLGEDKVPFIQYSPYCYWWLGTARSQGIMSHSIDLVFWNILAWSLEGLTQTRLQRIHHTWLEVG